MVITFGQIEMDRVVRYGCVVGKSRAEGRARGNVTNAVRSTHHLAARSARFSRVCDEYRVGNKLPSAVLLRVQIDKMRDTAPHAYSAAPVRGRRAV